MWGRPPAAKPVSLKGRALRLLARREYTRAELQRKLAPLEEAPGTLQPVLDELQAKGFLSDDRALESLLNRRAARLGTQRLLQELQAKGLDAQRIAAAGQRLRESEISRARAVWQKKFDRRPADARELARQARFLAARGFAADAIRRVLRSDADELPEE